MLDRMTVGFFFFFLSENTFILRLWKHPIGFVGLIPTKHEVYILPNCPNWNSFTWTTCFVLQAQEERGGERTRNCCAFLNLKRQFTVLLRMSCIKRKSIVSLTETVAIKWKMAISPKDDGWSQVKTMRKFKWISKKIMLETELFVD